MRKRTHGRHIIDVPVYTTRQTKFGEIREFAGTKQVHQKGYGHIPPVTLFGHIHHKKEKELRKLYRKTNKHSYKREEIRKQIQAELYTGMVYTVNSVGTVKKDDRPTPSRIVRKMDNPKLWHENQRRHLRTRKAA